MTLVRVLILLQCLLWEEPAIAHLEKAGVSLSLSLSLSPSPPPLISLGLTYPQVCMGWYMPP